MKRECHILLHETYLMGSHVSDKGLLQKEGEGWEKLVNFFCPGYLSAAASSPLRNGLKAEGNNLKGFPPWQFPHGQEFFRVPFLSAA